jgi:GDP-L-fucose synthase
MKVLVVGAETLLGQALFRVAKVVGGVELCGDGIDPSVWRNPSSARAVLEQTQPEAVLIAGGLSAGIEGNRKRPATLMADNMAMEIAVIPQAFAAKVPKLLFVASSCCYPKGAPQPLSPDSIFTGPLEPTSQSYAVAKLAGLQLCAAYRQQYGVFFFAAIVADLYGPGDDFSLEDSHVLPALLRKMHDAKVRGDAAVTLWGTGEPKRDFLFADDAAQACLRALQLADLPSVFNVTAACYTPIREAAEIARKVVGYRGDILFDTSKPDGAMLKGLAQEREPSLGISPSTNLFEGLTTTYHSFCQQAMDK